MTALAKWTVDDYHRLIDSGILSQRRVELLQGDLIEMAPEGPGHAYTTESGTSYLRAQLKHRAVVREAHPITLAQSEPQPDIAVVQPPRDRYRERHPSAAEIFWLIEVAQSTLAYDLGEKKRVYATAGIPEYWVIDLANRQIFRFSDPLGETYGTELRVSQGSLRPVAFPELDLQVGQFFSG
ncbi:Uma2 family endonuclease [Romeria aff. gracilis LEGE 07310]|uniref:Uma2 family endonuclease n=1 Tax=Vasconcelosia minhoensis LEGE 07310 TaxID=915328 RepID=A0A8J7ANI8_9CYAN|nr:Uma2 family endonuclease [Romeria gracilis]MBE9078330.1 Uma2 family endonuclease [Romeria aff. gracilis LEGE 07310]